MSLFINNNFQTITRLLQEEDDTTNNNNSNITQTEMIRNACILYGSIFIALFILFIIVRPCYPTIYNIKKSYPKLQKLHRAIDDDQERDREGETRIDENEYHTVDNDNNTLPNINDDINAPANNNNTEAVCNNSYGPISWIYKIYDASYDSICDECGVDAVTTIRLLEMGVKLSLVGVFNSAFLVPVYALLGDVVAQSGTPDPVKGVSLSNLNQGSRGTIATTISAYIFFISSMYFISQDLNWFTIKRHEYLCKRLVMNYSVYVSGLPDDMKSNGVLKDYFNNCFSSSYFAHHHHGASSNVNGGEDEVTNVVASANVALNIPNLQKEVDKRIALISKLEHAINVEQVKGTTPTHKANGIRGSVIGAQTVDSVPAYTEELQELNNDIGNRIDNIMKRVKARDAEGGEVIAEGDVEAGDVGTTRGGDVMTTTTDAHTAVQALPEEEEDRSAFQQQQDESADTPKYKRAASRLSDTVKVGTSVVKSIIFNDKEDGDARNAAFVSFNNLTSANLARQAVHNQRAWSVVAQKAPLPELVNWKNVGKSNVSKQVGEFLSLVFTFTLCIFWTIPVAFVSSLSNVDKLTETFTFLAEPVSKYPWFAELLAILAPFILVVFVSLLPYILLAFVKFEGLIEIETMQHPSLFTKLASFTIIQTFFISTIAGTLFASIQDIIQNPTQGIADIASALPEQSAYFIQIIIVQNLPPLGIELLRISPIVQNILRGIVSNRLGHNLTEKERSTTFMGLRSLNDPLEYYFGRELGSKTILAMMTLYVYGSGMAPITSYFTLIVFGFLAIGFRHQFIYIYPIGNDSGGDLWIRFTRISITCMIVAEIVLLIVLFLKEAFIAGVLLVPLPIATILFDQYFKRRHYAITANLPLGDCAVVDRKNEGILINEWLMDAYLQPALKKRSEFPDNYNGTNDEDGDLKDDTIETRAADDHKLKGNEHLAKKEYELALHHYTQAIETAPNAPSSHIYYCNRAAAYCYVGEYQAAADDCLSSIQLKPDYEKAYTRLGLALFFQGEYEQAVDAYQKSLDLDPTNEAAFNYLIKAKEKLATSRHDEVEISSPLSKSDSFDPSITNND